MDLLIRTSGELRTSNFLPWQLVYAEMVFDDCYWPDFDRAHYLKCLRTYAARDRRFGGVKASAPEVKPEAEAETEPAIKPKTEPATDRNSEEAEP